MNKESYDFINDEIIPAYNKIDKDIKIKYNANFENYKNKMDIKRDDYLNILMNKIEKIKNASEAKIKLNEIYHFSDAEKDRKTILYLFSSKISYKEYWKNKKNDYLKKLNKN